MAPASIKRIVREELPRRFLTDGGIADLPRGQFRTDATAWGILAFGAAGGRDDFLERHRTRLVYEQGEDGRVSLSQQHPDSYWPTALAILAWQDFPTGSTARSRAIRFLLDSTGIHAPRTPGDPAAHDTLLKGWPWVGGTHSWIEPTALSVIALKTAGHGLHDRVSEAVRMILDRQLPQGGWNYGNTIMFGKELHPMPESTGAALAGLAGMVGREKVIRGLDYLQVEVGRLRTPISLGWTLLGLAAWGLWPANSLALVERCLANQSRYGEYDTSALCLLFLGALAGEKDNNVALLANSSGRRVPALVVS
jgi:hypothetical protein